MLKCLRYKKKIEVFHYDFCQNSLFLTILKLNWSKVKYCQPFIVEFSEHRY